MKHAWWIVGVLVLVGATLVSADKKDAGEPKPKPVVVDPLDLRPPIPEPRAALTEKYDGKLVRFTGRVKTSGQDARTKTFWYDLQTEIVHPTGIATVKKGVPAPTSGKKARKTVTEIVVVRAYFATAQKNLRPQKEAAEVTVEGQGEIGYVDGALAIRKATVLDPSFLPKGAPRIVDRSPDF